MDQLKDRVIAAILGVPLACVSIVITGIGAAVVIPTDMLKPVAQ